MGSFFLRRNMIPINSVFHAGGSHAIRTTDVTSVMSGLKSAARMLLHTQKRCRHSVRRRRGRLSLHLLLFWVFFSYAGAFGSTVFHYWCGVDFCFVYCCLPCDLRCGWTGCLRCSCFVLCSSCHRAASAPSSLLDPLLRGTTTCSWSCHLSGGRLPTHDPSPSRFQYCSRTHHLSGSCHSDWDPSPSCSWTCHSNRDLSASCSWSRSRPWRLSPHSVLVGQPFPVPFPDMSSVH